MGPGDLVLDLGAGTGAITEPLLIAGATVVAVERHPGRRRALERRLGEHPGLRIVAGDLLEMPLPRRGFRVVSSPPYAVSSALVRRLVARDSALVAAHLVVQRQFARRVLDGRPATGRFRAEVVRSLPRSAFARPPRVDSVVLRLESSRGRGQRPTSASPRAR